MAESVARVKVQATADLKGLDDAARALKGLQQAIAPTDAALSKARLEIIQFGYANKQTEKLIAAQINALKSLRTEAQVGGRLYESLGTDINDLKNKLNGTSAATEKAASSFEQLGRAATSIQNSLQKQGQSFSAFKRQAGDTGKAVGELAAAFNIKFDNASKNIQDAARQLENLKRNASNIGSMFQGPQKGGGLFEIPRKGLADIQAFSQLVTRLKEQTETATGRVARLSEGLFAAGVAGKGISATVASLGGVAGAAENVAKFAANLSASFAQMGAGAPQWAGGMKAALNQISLLLNEPANGVANWVSSLNNAQAKLTTLNVPLEAFNNALAAIGPEGAAVAGVLAVSFAGLQDAITRAFRAGDKEASEALQSITDETQRLINKLAQLSEAFRSAASMNELQALRAGGAARFNETPAGTDASRRAANTIASAEARIKAESMAQAEVLEAARQRYRGTTESVDALSERLAYLQQAMKYVDQSTAEGKAEFAAFSNEANKVKGQIDQLSNSYRTVADAIRDAARAQGEYANQSTVNNYLNRAATRQQEELVAAARTALSRPQTPLLPAAGQTSFAGTYGPGGIGGGARMGTGRGETPFIIGTENVGVGTAVYRGAERTEMEIAGAAAALERDMRTAAAAVNNADKEVDDLKKSFQELIAPVEKVAKSEFFSPKSINALKARREQIDRERNAVDMLGDEYKRLSSELAKVDKQIERTQPGGLRGKIGYIGQGIGAAASAGIFGGPEGAIGGLLGGGLGALLGGPAGFAAGSFIGSSAGAYAGMGRQQLGQFSTYAADISKLEIALKGVTKTQEEYQRALAASASVTRDFNVPQLEATRGMTQLSAAVIGAGGKVADAEVVFRNVTAAIKASGGTSEDVQGALTALGQVFSKGKVSAEELQGQLGERLPGAVTMFAKATGRTLPQLQKDLEQGVVGLADLMRFITSDQGLGQFEQRAKAVADSSAEAGARLTTTWNDTKRAIGEALLPLGAQIQDSLANALRDATPALVSFAQGAATLIKLLADNAGLIGGVLKTLLGFAAVAGAAVGATKLAGAIGSVSLAVKSLGGVISATTLAARTLGLSIAAIPGIGWVAAGVTALGLLTVELYNNNSAFKTWVDNLATVISSDFRNAWDQAVSIASSATDEIGKALSGLPGIASSVGSAISSRLDIAFGGIAKRVRDFWNSLPVPIREAMSRGAVAAVGGLISPGNPVGGYVAGAVIRAGQMGPNAQDSGMFGRYDVAGGKTDREGASAAQLTNFQNLQEQARDKAADLAQKREDSLFNAREQYEERIAEIRRSAIEQAQQLERQFADERRNTERDIERVRRQIAATQASTAFDRRIQAGEDPSIVEAERGVDQIMRKAEEERIRIREEYSDKELQRTRTIADFQKNIADQINKANEAYAKQIGKIQREYAINSARAVEKGGDAAGKQLEQSARLSALYLQRGSLNAIVATTSGAFVADPSRPGGAGFSVDEFLGKNWGTQLGKELGAIIAIDQEIRAIRGQVQQFRPPAAPVLPPGVRQIPVSQQVDTPGFAGLAQTNAAAQQVQLDRTEAEAAAALEKRFTSISEESLRQVQTLEEQNALILLQAKYLNTGVSSELAQQLAQLEQSYEKQKKLIEDERAAQLKAGVEAARVDALYKSQLATARKQYGIAVQLTQEYVKQQQLLRLRQDTNIGAGIREGAQQYVESIGTMREATSQLAQTGIKGVEDAIFSLVTTGTANFREFAASILKDTARMIIQQLILRTIMQAIGAIGGGGGFGKGYFDPVTGLGAAGPNFGLAMGGVIGRNGLQPFAMGGIVTKPTLFRYASGGVPGMGLMGEAGPEAIIPLRRGRDGKLGVASGGGGAPVTVNVSVDAKGTSVQGNSGQGDQLGRAVAAAVQAELVRQKRPGGLLAA